MDNLVTIILLVLILIAAIILIILLLRKQSLSTYRSVQPLAPSDSPDTETNRLTSDSIENYGNISTGTLSLTKKDNYFDIPMLTWRLDGTTNAEIMPGIRLTTVIISLNVDLTIHVDSSYKGAIQKEFPQSSFVDGTFTHNIFKDYGIKPVAIISNISTYITNGTYVPIKGPGQLVTTDNSVKLMSWDASVIRVNESGDRDALNVRSYQAPYGVGLGTIESYQITLFS